MNNLAMLAAIDKNRFDPRRRAFVLLRSGLRLDLLNPDPHAWTDEDLAAGLARTLRWGGASRWAACVARTRPGSMLAAGSGCRRRSSARNGSPRRSRLAAASEAFHVALSPTSSSRTNSLASAAARSSTLPSTAMADSDFLN